jgi:hypothetical protein
MPANGLVFRSKTRLGPEGMVFCRFPLDAPGVAVEAPVVNFPIMTMAVNTTGMLLLKAS